VELPSNSHESRAAPDDKRPEKRILKVVDGSEGGVVRRKKSSGSRLRELFLGDDPASVLEYVVKDVMIPAAKDMITDAFAQGIERFFFGENARPRRRPTSGTSVFGNTSQSHTNYTRYSSSSSRPEERPVARRNRSSRDFDDIIIPNRGQAEEVLDQLKDIVDKYEAASVKDLYEIVGVDFHHTDAKWGWTNLEDARIRRVSNGYLLELPRTEALD